MTKIELEAANQTIARTLAETLNKHYPGHAWAVKADVEQGVANVFNLALSGEWGFVLRLDELMNDPNMKLTIRAGGELLERYRLSRGKLKEQDMAELSFDIKGNARPC
ncbi:MAG: hypothetical protein PHT88_04715 [Candidatus Moranbacteria bacterium]|nr:hypothetical protein [Candidatus Moranbacteria bacterium]